MYNVRAQSVILVFQAMWSVCYLWANKHYSISAEYIMCDSNYTSLIFLCVRIMMVMNPGWMKLCSRNQYFELKVSVHLKLSIPTHQVVVLSVVFVEAIVVLVRSRNHVRVTRALRPLFLIDSHYCFGVRR